MGYKLCGPGQMKEEQDNILTNLVLHRTTSAIEALYNRYAPVLLSLCLRYMGNIADAEDTLHDGFIKIINNINKFRGGQGSSLEAWMKKIMVNTALNSIRSHNKEKLIVDQGTMIENISIPQEEEQEYQEILSDLGKETIMEMVCQLPVGYRTVFNLYVFEEYSHREIAESLKISENTSKSQLSKARALLRKQLNEMVVKKAIDI
jgi:RNA polymerase sigma-70 factor, ECF subfamily